MVRVSWFLVAVLPFVAVTAQDINSEELVRALQDVMLGPQMTGKLIKLMNEVLDRRLLVDTVHTTRLLQEETQDVTCTLEACGDDPKCTSANGMLENVGTCSQCTAKKDGVNYGLGCTCSSTCSIPPPVTPAPTALLSIGESSGAAEARRAEASQNIGDATLWVEEGAIGIGATADVRLYRAEGEAPVLGAKGSLHLVQDSDDVVLKLHPKDGSKDALIQLVGESSNGDIAAEGFEVFYDNSVGDVHLSTTWDDDAAAIRFHTKSGASKERSTANERLTIAGNGNVGIGTTDPAAPLHVSGAWVNNHGVISVESGANGLNGIGFRSDGNYKASLIFRDGSSGNYMDWSTFGTAKMYLSTGGHNPRLAIDAHGKVGIGTTEPAAPLHVSGAWVNNHGVISVESGANGLNGIGFRSDGNYKASLIFRDGSSGNYMDWSTFGTAKMYLSTGGHNPRLAIDAAGMVGIGTTEPQAKLDVVGDLHVSGKIMLAGKDITEYFATCSWRQIAESGTTTDVNAQWWDAHCTAVGNPLLTTTDTVRIDMGQVKDYIRPTSNMNLCTMMKSNNKYTWSATGEEGSFRTVSLVYTAHFGGCATHWTKSIDGRNYLSFWGGNGALGGCCHYTSTNYGGSVDGGAWKRAFKVYLKQC